MALRRLVLRDSCLTKVRGFMVFRQTLRPQVQLKEQLLQLLEVGHGGRVAV